MPTLRAAVLGFGSVVEFGDGVRKLKLWLLFLVLVFCNTPHGNFFLSEHGTKEKKIPFEIAVLWPHLMRDVPHYKAVLARIRTNQGTRKLQMFSHPCLFLFLFFLFFLSRLLSLNTSLLPQVFPFFNLSQQL